MSKPFFRGKELTGKVFGKLTVIAPTAKRDYKGSILWKCRCECGNETEYSEDALVYGNCRSCGCLKKELQKNIKQQLTFVDNTCVEWLKSRKSRSDNTSGFRGVCKLKSGKYAVSIGLQKERYHIGYYDSYEEAVSARMYVEEKLHNGFLTTWNQWKGHAATNPTWGEQNPFFFDVQRSPHRCLTISSPFITQEISLP